MEMDLAGNQQQQQQPSGHQQPDHQQPSGNGKHFTKLASDSDVDQSDKEVNSRSSSSGKVTLEETVPNGTDQQLVTSPLPARLPSAAKESSSSPEQANDQNSASQPATDGVSPAIYTPKSIEEHTPESSAHSVYIKAKSEPPEVSSMKMASSGSPIKAIEEAAIIMHNGPSLPTSKASKIDPSPAIKIPQKEDQSLQFPISIDCPSMKNHSDAATKQGAALIPQGGIPSPSNGGKDRPRNTSSPLNVPKSEENTPGNSPKIVCTSSPLPPYMNPSYSQPDEQNMAVFTSQVQHYDTLSAAAGAVKDETTSLPTPDTEVQHHGTLPAVAGTVKDETTSLPTPDTEDRVSTSDMPAIAPQSGQQTPAAEIPPASPQGPLSPTEESNVTMEGSQGSQQGAITSASEVPIGPPEQQQETEHTTTQPLSTTGDGASSPAEELPAPPDGHSKQEGAKRATHNQSAAEGLTTHERNGSNVSCAEEFPVPSHRSAEEDRPQDDGRGSPGGASVHIEPLASPEEGGGALGDQGAAPDGALSSTEQQVAPHGLVNLQQGLLDELVYEGCTLRRVISKDKLLKVLRKGYSWEDEVNLRIYGILRKDVTFYIALRPSIQCRHHNNENIAKLYTRVEMRDRFWGTLKSQCRDCFVLVKAWILDRQKNEYSLQDDHEHQITQVSGIGYDQDLVSCDDMRECTGETVTLVVEPKLITRPYNFKYSTMVNEDDFCEVSVEPQTGQLYVK